MWPSWVAPTTRVLSPESFTRGFVCAATRMTGIRVRGCLGVGVLRVCGSSCLGFRSAFVITSCCSAGIQGLEASSLVWRGLHFVSITVERCHPLLFLEAARGLNTELTPELNITPRGSMYTTLMEISPQKTILIMA